MKAHWLISCVVLMAFARQSSAHRLDEYLQAATIALEEDRIKVEMRLSPGVAVAQFVLAAMDTDGDGAISEVEEAAYAERLVRDLSLTLDGKALSLHLFSKTFGSPQDMREGRGEIRLEFYAGDPRPFAPSRTLLFENRHQRQIGAYLVNALVPRDPGLQVTAQSRNYEQSSYRLDYTQGVPTGSIRLAWWSNERAWLIALALLMTTRFAVLLLRRRAAA